MVARFFADAADLHSPIPIAVAHATMENLAAEIERVGADILIVSGTREEGAALSARLFRTTSLSVLVRLSVSGHFADLHSRDAPPSQATALDASQLLDQAVRLAGTKERPPHGRS